MEQKMLVALLICAFVSLSSGYQRSGVLSSLTSKKSTTSQQMASYEEMMEAAKLKKTKGRAPPRKAPSGPVATSIPGYTPPKESTGGLPFNDRQYNDLKYIIEKLTGKIKSDISLSPEELTKFENAVEAVIADAGVGGLIQRQPKPSRQSPPQRQKQPSNTQPSKSSNKQNTERKYISNVDQYESRYFSNASPEGEEVPLPDIAVESIELTEDIAARDKQLFDTTFGKLGSSWQFEGMEKIDNPDDFYKAINKRSAAIRQLRSQYASRESASDYTASLNAKKN